MASQQNSFANVATIGIDIGKTTFHLIGQDRRGAIIMRAKLSRTQLMRRLVNVPQCVIGMEPCAGAHHIARRLSELGHDVRLVPAQPSVYLSSCLCVCVSVLLSIQLYLSL